MSLVSIVLLSFHRTLAQYDFRSCYTACSFLFHRWQSLFSLLLGIGRCIQIWWLMKVRNSLWNVASYINGAVRVIRPTPQKSASTTTTIRVHSFRSICFLPTLLHAIAHCTICVFRDRCAEKKNDPTSRHWFCFFLLARFDRRAVRAVVYCYKYELRFHMTTMF